MEKLQDKSDRLNLFIEQQNKFVNTGKKFFEIIGKFKHHKTDKAMNEALKKMASIEKSKILEQSKPLVFAKNITSPELPILSKEEEEKAVALEKAARDKKIEEMKKALQIGAKVKLKNQQTLGTILELSGKKITVQVGNFILKTSTSEIEI